MVLYYVPFHRDLPDTKVHQIQGSQGAPNLMNRMSRFKMKRSTITFGENPNAAGTFCHMSLQNEGMYAMGDGRNLDHKDKIADQDEISAFVDKLFAHIPNIKQLTFDQYCHLNKNVSSAMFTSVLALLH